MPTGFQKILNNKFLSKEKTKAEKSRRASKKSRDQEFGFVHRLKEGDVLSYRPGSLKRISENSATEKGEPDECRKLEFCK